MIYFRKTLNVRIILQIGLTFVVVLVLAKTKGQRSKGPPVTLVLHCSRQVATNAPENLTARRPFWCPYRNVEIYHYHHAQEH